MTAEGNMRVCVVRYAGVRVCAWGSGECGMCGMGGWAEWDGVGVGEGIRDGGVCVSLYRRAINPVHSDRMLFTSSS